MPSITRIFEYHNKDLIQLIEEWLEQAKRGELTGIAFAVRLGQWNHGMGLVGSYANDPAAASAVVGQLFSAISRHAISIGVVNSKGGNDENN